MCGLELTHCNISWWIISSSSSSSPSTSLYFSTSSFPSTSTSTSSPTHPLLPLLSLTHVHTPGLKKESGKRDEIAKFLEHATLLRGIEHPNIQSVLCVSVEDNYVPLVVYPMVEYGNMHDVLLSCRLSPDQSPLNVSERERGRERRECWEGRDG